MSGNNEVVTPSRFAGLHSHRRLRIQPGGSDPPVSTGAPWIRAAQQADARGGSRTFYGVDVAGGETGGVASRVGGKALSNSFLSAV